MSRGVLIAVASLCPCLGKAELVPLPSQSAQVPWPTQEWPVSPLPAAVDDTALQSAMEDAFGNRIPRLGDTHAVVLIQGGRLVYERYAEGFSSSTRLISWSMAKSITHALVGIAVGQGRVNIDAPMGNPRWKPDDPRAKITWRTWLQMTDGQRYVEDFARNWEENDAFKKLYGPGTLDVAAFCAGLPLIHQPGTFWNYNSCALVLTADALTRTIVPNPSSPEERRAAMLAWMHKVLFDVIGMSDVQPEFDASGLYYGSASVYATARDFAKFGLLYLRDGLWNGQRILPVGWVDFARTPGPAANADVYGAGWWVTPKQGSGVPDPEAIVTGPERDAFVAIGHEGQFIVVVPSKDLIIVRLGLSGDEPANWATFYDWLGRVGRAFPVVNPVK